MTESITETKDGDRIVKNGSGMIFYIGKDESGNWIKFLPNEVRSIPAALAQGLLGYKGVVDPAKEAKEAAQVQETIQSLKASIESLKKENEHLKKQAGVFEEEKHPLPKAKKG